VEQYKSSEKRLAKWFSESRDSWKEKALSRQKELRALEVKIRDLENSRDNWKKRAKKAEKEQKKRIIERRASEKSSS
jgi:hypothetical protein